MKFGMYELCKLFQLPACGQLNTEPSAYTTSCVGTQMFHDVPEPKIVIRPTGTST
ncbi:hypothetical protein CCHR01_05695 [Colletotrichum chrysophilum]|uniref:Uncharacterized protein n=1 Tax=Colletotrichum chrysophilum TaxID=1836956 RepID=A0AAD9EP69_9PEZI|nr:hypothetical protein CCHR01_05695 [Colletotrichum chrysophilum]